MTFRSIAAAVLALVLLASGRVEQCCCAPVQQPGSHPDFRQLLQKLADFSPDPCGPPYGAGNNWHLATPFPTGRKLTAGRPRFFPTRRKFRKNFLDNISCLCASLEGSGKAAAGEAPAGKDLPACQGVHENTRTSANLGDFREIISYSIKSICLPSLQQSGLLSLREIPFRQNVAVGNWPSKKRC
jgi:hypothetical protein